jgi:integrase
VVTNARWISLYEGTKHTMATDAIRRRVPERSLPAYLGHADAASTRRYARLSDQALLEVIRPPQTARCIRGEKDQRDQ